jgi:hypothetical protein
MKVAATTIAITFLLLSFVLVLSSYPDGYMAAVGAAGWALTARFWDSVSSE